MDYQECSTALRAMVGRFGLLSSLIGIRYLMEAKSTPWKSKSSK
jgi:hypothetical protein